jgi:putative sterol carrier protein
MTPVETLTLPQPPPAVMLPPVLREGVARHRFELSDGHSFLLTLARGRLSLEEAGGEADAVYQCSRDELHRLLSGELNLLTALMRGDVQVSGDLESAKRLYRYLRLASGK